ncbi:hypothetical protein P7K49_010385 [Saguinus oedipus]|uniref:Uncharacterized protein n=1 Tax=Saguinus oedipus TaxID=9490 RepID=A0ABQ9VMN0_SAGOE|nr:hypothetical protein P7K49_010385 [Saguinus oedipus]
MAVNGASCSPAHPRFCLFHSFFVTKKHTSQIPETRQQLSLPLESQAREAVSSAFFRWEGLQDACSLQFPYAGDNGRGPGSSSRSWRGGRPSPGEGGGRWLYSLTGLVTKPCPSPSLLQTLSTQFKLAPEQTRGGQPWTYRLVQFADLLLNHSHSVSPVTPLTAQQRQAWDR